MLPKAPICNILFWKLIVMNANDNDNENDNGDINNVINVNNKHETELVSYHN